MMRVIALRRFNDLKEEVVRQEGDIFTVGDDRYFEIMSKRDDLIMPYEEEAAADPADEGEEAAADPVDEGEEAAADPADEDTAKVANPSADEADDGDSKPAPRKRASRKQTDKK